MSSVQILRLSLITVLVLTNQSYATDLDTKLECYEAIVPYSKSKITAVVKPGVVAFPGKGLLANAGSVDGIYVVTKRGIYFGMFGNEKVVVKVLRADLNAVKNGLPKFEKAQQPIELVLPDQKVLVVDYKLNSDGTPGLGSSSTERKNTKARVRLAEAQYGSASINPNEFFKDEILRAIKAAKGNKENLVKALASCTKTQNSEISSVARAKLKELSSKSSPPSASHSEPTIQARPVN